eukprot:82214-Pelagomonas_calceolata.AAC.8
MVSTNDTIFHSPQHPAHPNTVLKMVVASITGPLCVPKKGLLLRAMHQSTQLSVSSLPHLLYMS